MATLYLVATPIGNLGDITLRALETLKAADAIACEDTRHTLRLLTHYGIRKPLVSCHANDEARGAARVVDLLRQGRSVAYCSDAGTPGLSDPGTLLARTARDAGFQVSPIPGPSAFAALISAAGMGGRSYLFDGFPSPKAGRRASRVRELMAREEAFVLYESPHRVARLMADIAETDPSRRVCVGREMTKIHEEFITGTASEVAARFPARDDGPGADHEAGRDAVVAKGEFAVLVAGADDKDR